MKKYNDSVENAKKWYNCNMCDYRVKKEITLEKYINTKHSRNGEPEGKAFSIFCDECEHGYHSKKSLKKHKAQRHEGHIHQCNICEKYFKSKKNLDSHVEKTHDVSSKEITQSVCTCTDNTVCDKCLHEDGYLY